MANEKLKSVTQGEPERPWTCDTCGTQFAEYVNGCPKCWDNGKLSSVRQSPAQTSPVVQTEKHFDQIKSSLQAALSHIKGELYRLPASDKSRVSAQKDILSGLIGRLNAAVSDLDAITSLAPVVPVEETMPPAVRKMRDACFDITCRTITCAIRDYSPEYSGKEALKMLLESIAFMGKRGFGDDTYSDNKVGAGPPSYREGELDEHQAYFTNSLRRCGMHSWLIKREGMSGMVCCCGRDRGDAKGSFPMTTNPSTGLPEELEKIVQQTAENVSNLFNGDISKGAKISDHIRFGARDVLDWACKKVCMPCSKGWPVVRCGDVNFPWIHPKMEGKIAATTCAASVLREGN